MGLKHKGSKNKIEFNDIDFPEWIYDIGWAEEAERQKQ